MFSFVRRGAPGARATSVVRRATSRPSRTATTGSACPPPATWEEVVNTDASGYTGSGVGNLGAVTAVDGDWSGQPAYADITVPPLATVWFRHVT